VLRIIEEIQLSKL